MTQIFAVLAIQPRINIRKPGASGQKSSILSSTVINKNKNIEDENFFQYGSRQKLVISSNWFTAGYYIEYTARKYDGLSTAKCLPPEYVIIENGHMTSESLELIRCFAFLDLTAKNEKEVSRGTSLLVVMYDAAFSNFESNSLFFGLESTKIKYLSQNLCQKVHFRVNLW